MIERIPLSVANNVDTLRQQGRTDRQIEKMLGLPSGLLARRYLIDDTEEREVARSKQATAEWVERSRQFWNRQFRPQKTLHGWRPANDCITDRPNAGTHHRPRKPA